MATHSSILAWRIPWTEEPGSYSPWGGKELDMIENRSRVIRKQFGNKPMQFSSVQSLSRVQLFATPQTTAHQASLSIINSWSLLKFISIESVMPSNHLIICHPLLLLPSIFPSTRVFSNESALRMKWPKYRSFSFNISLSNE